MPQTKVQKPKKINQNFVESLKGGSSVDDFDQFFSDYENFQEEVESSFPEAKKHPKKRQEFSIFNYQNYYEKEIVRKQIKELSQQINKEIEMLKKADVSLQKDVREVEKIVLEEVPDKPGIYHVRFLEIILGMLRHMRENIGESKTWLQAMISRKKKRGSLFAALTKKKGTQYSLSNEIQTARGVQ